MNYCHECAEMQLKYSLRLYQINYPVASDEKNRCFYITDPSDKKFTISVDTLSIVTPDNVIIASKDWNQLILSILKCVKQ